MTETDTTAPPAGGEDPGHLLPGDVWDRVQADVESDAPEPGLEPTWGEELDAAQRGGVA